MALLGKTLKGRSLKEGGISETKRIKNRYLVNTQEELDQQMKLNKIKRDNIRRAAEEEATRMGFNKKKLIAYWRKFLRFAKTQSLQNEMSLYMQNNQRNLDSKEGFIQMLDKNLDEADSQFNICLRSHLIHLSKFLDLQDSRLRGLKEEFLRDVTILEEEFTSERDDMTRTHTMKVKELKDMIDEINDEEKKKAEEAESEHQAYREETKNRNIEETNLMRSLLEAKQTKYYNELEQLNQKYTSETAKKTQEHAHYFDMNKSKSKDIDSKVRAIANNKADIDLMRLKILQHRKECQARNLALKKEKENISKNYQELKSKMLKFREEENKRLTELVNNSRNAVFTLKEYVSLGEKILKLSELCRRLETEREKVLPFYQDTVEAEEIPQELQIIFEEITPEMYSEYSYLNSFYKRFNKVLLDKLAIGRHKESLANDNAVLKDLLKQYLDGISVNDDVLKVENPLLSKIKMVVKEIPAERIIEEKGRTFERILIEGAEVVRSDAKHKK